MREFTKAVAYARYSTEMQREESIEAQLRAIREYAEKNNMLIIRQYIDRAKSATSDKRPEFLQMIADAKEHNFNAVVVHKLDRFSRDRYDSAYYKRELKRHRVALYSVTEPLDDSPESVMMESVLEGMNEFYSRNLGREVMKGLKENARKGMATGGPPPFGFKFDYETKKLLLDEWEAEGVRLIFDMILEGHSYREVIEELNRRGYVTRYKKPFTINSLHNLLKNEKYRGCYTYNKSIAKDIDGRRNGHSYKPDDQIIRVENGCPRIVSDADFFMVQEKMKVRQQAVGHPNVKENYLLRGKMFCGKCGGVYVGSRRRRGDGSIWAYYVCNQKARRKQKHNHTKDIGKDYIEKEVLKQLAAYAFSDFHVKSMVAEYNAYLATECGGRSETAKLKQRLTKLNADLENLTDCLIQTKSPTLFEKLEKLEQQKAEFEQMLFEREKIYTVSQVTEEELQEVFRIIRSKIEDGSLQALKQLIEVYVNRIDVTDEQITVRFNFFPKVSVPFATGGGTSPLFAMPQTNQDGFACEMTDEDQTSAVLMERLTLTLRPKEKTN